MSRLRIVWAPFGGCGHSQTFRTLAFNSARLHRQHSFGLQSRAVCNSSGTDFVLLLFGCPFGGHGRFQTRPHSLWRPNGPEPSGISPVDLPPSTPGERLSPWHFDAFPFLLIGKTRLRCDRSVFWTFLITDNRPFNFNLLITSAPLITELNKAVRRSRRATFPFRGALSSQLLSPWGNSVGLPSKRPGLAISISTEAP